MVVFRSLPHSLALGAHVECVLDELVFEPCDLLFRWFTVVEQVAKRGYPGNTCI